ncbi:aspartate kinase [Aquibacillus sp. 3ASR75-11]|uniref:Aspartokinase n=1 Tax=Terrihalobacillus insolitus TaxID=2950438 RepID=A0A9X3WWC1_9BACI|nr:aspartate kinase [Terrihalobacillus insolitus]MDC3414446.1 aspartate kinase [Terrihalobacillus insolitus]MDC3425326.1 aspartate kinase [Terrihalobacillus insolitus]
MKVVKFGGSSVASAEQLEKVANIIKADKERKIVVVSAPGKRFKEDEKVTDLLIELGEAFLDGKDYQNAMNKIVNRFSDITTALGLDDMLLRVIQDDIASVVASDQANELKMDALKAIGEDSLAKVFGAYLASTGTNATYINPRDAGIFVSDQPGNAQILEESFEKLYQLRNRDEILVIPGFFGYTKQGTLMTFPRGGSDITGSIVAAGVKADLYENFTDVDSVFCVNPTIVKQPKEITTLTYREMRELSYAGFSVFHDEALIPAFKAKIPVCIKNTNNPSASGTMIVSERKLNGNPVVGIASDTGFISLYISKYLMNREIGFGRRLLNILEDEHISFEHAPSGIDDMTVILRESQLTPEKEERIMSRIKEELKADTISIERDLAMIMIVGEGMNSAVGVAKNATAAFANANINIEMINQGSSEVSVMFGVKSSNLEPAVRSLYDMFFNQ